MSELNIVAFGLCCFALGMNLSNLLWAWSGRK